MGEITRIIQLLTACLILVSCDSVVKKETRTSEQPKQEVIRETIEPRVSYPNKITQRNLRERYVESEKTYFKYDSLEITHVSDSSYFYHYFRYGMATAGVWDTTMIPDQAIANVDTMNGEESSRLYNPFSSPGIGERLHEIKIEDKIYKVIEFSSSCCKIWQPRGHVHMGSKMYFSLDFGIIGTFQMSEVSTSKTLWLGDWNQELVDQIIEKLPLANEHPYYLPTL